MWHHPEGQCLGSEDTTVEMLRDFHFRTAEEIAIESGRMAASYTITLLPALKTNTLTAVIFGFINCRTC